MLLIRRLPLVSEPGSVGERMFIERNGRHLSRVQDRNNIINEVHNGHMAIPVVSSKWDQGKSRGSK